MPSYGALSIITCGQNNLTKGRTTDVHRRFSCICQVAPMCTPSNTCFLGSTRHPKRHHDRLIRFCTAHGIQSIYFAIGRLFPFTIASSLGPTQVYSPNGISIGSAVFRAHNRDRQTDRPTDRPRYSVCNSKPHLHSTAMRPNNND